MKTLVAIPVYNEVRHIHRVLEQVRKYASDILTINDGSSDGSREFLNAETDLHVIHHRTNLGYGAALRSAFGFADAHSYDVLVTMDSDGQHEAERIPVLLEALTAQVDMVSGSRYLRVFKENTAPPVDRRRINSLLTTYLNQKLGLQITDAFCGFKAYRVKELRKLHITENGYGMPLQLWVQAANLGLRITEVAVPLVYLDANRTFGGGLDDADRRLAYYQSVIEGELERIHLGQPALEKLEGLPV
ncbi:MAG TPA: glycosyltransferase family 2 protein [Gemmatales bacterium]|nr:glycosyltransferase family 2 protein [Gemmatales bacterium]